MEVRESTIVEARSWGGIALCQDRCWDKRKRSPHFPTRPCHPLARRFFPHPGRHVRRKTVRACSSALANRKRRQRLSECFAIPPTPDCV